MKTNEPTIREIFDTKIAAKYGPDRDKILRFYDTMLEKHNGDELKALTEFETILKKFTPAAALKLQQEKLANEIAELQKGIKALSQTSASDCSKVLTPAAKQIFNALDGKTISVQSESDALSRVRQLQDRMAAQYENARKLEAELDTKEAKPNKDGDIDFGMVKLTPKVRAGLIQRTESFTSLASVKAQSGLQLDVVFINGR